MEKKRWSEKESETSVPLTVNVYRQPKGIWILPEKLNFNAHLEQTLSSDNWAYRLNHNQLMLNNESL
jgi:hypothetical protein